jgi:hypothetical protein
VYESDMLTAHYWTSSASLHSQTSVARYAGFANVLHGWSWGFARCTPDFMLPCAPRTCSAISVASNSQGAHPQRREHLSLRKMLCRFGAGLVGAAKINEKQRWAPTPNSSKIVGGPRRDGLRVLPLTRRSSDLRIARCALARPSRLSRRCWRSGFRFPSRRALDVSRGFPFSQHCGVVAIEVVGDNVHRACDLHAVSVGFVD